LWLFEILRTILLNLRTWVLDFLQCFVVVDGVGILGQVQDDLGIAIVQGGKDVVIDQILNVLAQGKRRLVDLKDHRDQGISMLLNRITML
jgi:hypothetical protein